MATSVWLWLGMAMNAALLFPGFYMASAAIGIARASNGSPAAIMVAALFFALPVLCIVAPLTAWRAASHGRFGRHTIAVLAAPLVYAIFLTYFLIG